MRKIQRKAAKTVRIMVKEAQKVRLMKYRAVAKALKAAQ